VPVIPVCFAIPGVVIFRVLRKFGNNVPEHSYYTAKAGSIYIHVNGYIETTTERGKKYCKNPVKR
jgi:hypothetical protein